MRFINRDSYYIPSSKSTLPRVCNLHNGSVEGVFHEWHSWLPCGANSLFLCKLRCWQRCSCTDSGTFVLPLWYHSLYKTCQYYYNLDSVSNQLLHHSWKTLSTLLLWRLHTLGNIFLRVAIYFSETGNICSLRVANHEIRHTQINMEISSVNLSILHWSY